jgi:hypothetical protein
MLHIAHHWQSVHARQKDKLLAILSPKPYLVSIVPVCELPGLRPFSLLPESRGVGKVRMITFISNSAHVHLSYKPSRLRERIAN